MSKTILITGSSKGIGKATALRFAKDNNNIVINYLKDKEGIESLILEIQKLGSKAIVVQADVTKEDEAKRLVDSAINEFGTIDILINNVGGYIDGDD
jgi:NAD(P)-dependent dehydrogenase (short-subunit alcohol dehydrogenase family)